MSNVNRKKRAALSYRFLFWALPTFVLGGLFSVLCPLGQPKPFVPAEFSSIESGVLGGALRPNAAGVVLLPPALAGASANGVAYVADIRGKCVIFVPSWIGRECLVSTTGDLWLEGYVFDPDKNIGLLDGWDVPGPPEVPFWTAKGDRHVEERSLLNNRDISVGWHAASIFLDD